MNKVVIAGILRAVAGPLVAVAGRHGYDISWLVDPEVLGCIVGLICAVWSVQAKRAAVPIEGPKEQPHP